MITLFLQTYKSSLLQQQKKRVQHGIHILDIKKIKKKPVNQSISNKKLRWMRLQWSPLTTYCVQFSEQVNMGEREGPETRVWERDAGEQVYSKTTVGKLNVHLNPTLIGIKLVR